MNDGNISNQCESRDLSKEIAKIFEFLGEFPPRIS